MRTNTIPTSLFDYDFTGETERMRIVAEIEEEERAERVARLEEMARKALEADRMGAYFRVLDELDALHVGEESALYSMPKVKLTYKGAKHRRKITGSESAANLMREAYEDGEIGMQEFVKVAYMNRQNEVFAIHNLSTGGTVASIYDLKILFAGAILANAEAIIICHNHPSGNLRPSPQDDKITRDTVEAGKLLGVRVLDHVILTEESYYSYCDNGKL